MKFNLRRTRRDEALTLHRELRIADYGFFRRAVTLLIVALLGFGFPVRAAEGKRANDLSTSGKASRKEKTKDASTVSTNDPVEIEYLKLLAMDNEAQTEVDRWIKEAQAFEAAGTPMSKAILANKVQDRLKVVKDAYEKFLSAHPKHAEARLAYGSFLMDIHEEDEAVVQMEKARETDPSNPAAWNNLANHYGHRGPVKKAFEYYAKAIELDPKEPVYRQNLATTTYLFRRDAEEFYNINEQQVFDKALDLYQQAMKLDPTNLVLAVDYAQSYYGIKPMRTNDALQAWTNALTLAKTPDEQQGIFLHLARVELNTGHWDEARVHLNAVTNHDMDVLKNRLARNWVEKRNKALGVTNSVELMPTNAPPSAVSEIKTNAPASAAKSD